MRAFLIGLFLFATTASAVEIKWREGDLVGYPAIFDDGGARIGTGDLQQHAVGNGFGVNAVYTFKDGRTVTEKAEFETKPELIQKKWSFEEKRGDTILRHYEVDFDSGRAVGEKHDGAKVKRWNESLKIEKGRTFAGLGFVFAAKNLAKEIESAPVELKAVAFTPKPRIATVQLRRDGDDTLTSGTSTVKATRIVIHPEVPAVARAFVHPKDATMWFAKRNPPQFLRSEATLAEPEEALVQINFFGSSSKIGRSSPEKRP